MENKDGTTGVVLMTYGSATTAEHVKEYFQTIYGGKASAELVADFENRYRLVGSSPLIRITSEQAMLLQKKLGEKYVVRAGMRHSAPKIADVIAECRAAGVQRIVGIVLSPQFSSIIMEGYRTAFFAATKAAGFEEGNAVIAGPWPTSRHFIELLAQRIKKSLSELSKKHTISTSVIFTTHSLPESVVKKDPTYLDQLKSTIDAVLKYLAAGGSPIEAGNWYAGYQSAGHTPEAWLKPDFKDIMTELKAKGQTHVLIAPVQFLADHLEILYDVGIGARAQAEENNIQFARTDSLNTSSLFIKALAHVVTQSLKKGN
jgi:ferrochelatase